MVTTTTIMTAAPCFYGAHQEHAQATGPHERDGLNHGHVRVIEDVGVVEGGIFK